MISAFDVTNCRDISVVPYGFDNFRVIVADGDAHLAGGKIKKSKAVSCVTL